MKQFEDMLFDALKERCEEIVKEESERAAERVRSRLQDSGGELVNAIMRKVKMSSNRDTMGEVEIRIKYPFV